MIHCIILLKIWLFKFSVFKKKAQVHDSQEVNCIGNRKMFPTLENSITSFPTSICNFIVLIIYAIALRKINYMQIKDVYKYPNYWFIMTFYLIGAIMVCMVICINYFITNSPLRHAVIREARQLRWWPNITIKIPEIKIFSGPKTTTYRVRDAAELKL